MKFYRRLTPVKAISFDLDDTLYSNQPIMQATAKAMVDYFQQEIPKLIDNSTDIQTNYNVQFWSFYKHQAIKFNPQLEHDVTELRVESYYLGLIDLGVNKAQARVSAEKALAHFNYHRSNFAVPDNIHSFLANLANKYPLIAISNGNVDTEMINLKQYFSGIYHAGGQYKMKPCTDMFESALQQLGIAPSELLHVGDCGKADILGGTLAGCQTAWVSSFDVGKPLSVLPTLALNNVTDLQHLL